jgi:hypothetical protein
LPCDPCSYPSGEQLDTEQIIERFEGRVTAQEPVAAAEEPNVPQVGDEPETGVEGKTITEEIGRTKEKRPRSWQRIGAISVAAAVVVVWPVQKVATMAFRSGVGGNCPAAAPHFRYNPDFAQAREDVKAIDYVENNMNRLGKVRKELAGDTDIRQMQEVAAKYLRAIWAQTASKPIPS